MIRLPTFIRPLLAAFLATTTTFAFAADLGPWKKHVVTEQGHCNTAIAIDVSGDGLLDVIASTNGKVSLFIAPGWEQQVVLHRFDGRGACIHSAPIDADGDGDMDWAGTLANAHHSLTIADFDQDGDSDVAACGYGSERVMWYENDGLGNFAQHTIDTGQQSYDLRSVDMDGDGDADLLNAGRGSNNVVWYENSLK